MALARLDIPGVVLYNGTIYPGTYKGKRDATIVTVYEAIGAYRAGKITLEELYEVENAACPGAGACGGQFTANTMSTVLEFLGLSPAGLNGIPAEDPAKDEAARRGGRARDGPRAPRHPAVARSSRRESIENAIASVSATGGSTNAVLHLPAIAPEFGHAARRSTSSARSPTAPRSSPTCGRAAGTRPPTCTTRAAWPWSCASCSSAGPPPRRREDGRRPHDRRRSRRAPPRRPASRSSTRSRRRSRPTGGLAILRGSLAPEGCVVKLAGHERRHHRGPARVFDSEHPCFEAVKHRADPSRATSS